MESTAAEIGSSHDIERTYIKFDVLSLFCFLCNYLFSVIVCLQYGYFLKIGIRAYVQFENNGR